MDPVEETTQPVEPVLDDPGHLEDPAETEDWKKWTTTDRNTRSTRRTLLSKWDAAASDHDQRASEPPARLSVQDLTVADPDTGGRRHWEATGLDCTSPVRITSIRAKTICQATPAAQKEGEPRNYAIFQKNKSKVRKGFRCSLVATDMAVICGAFSHKK